MTDGGKEREASARRRETAKEEEQMVAFVPRRMKEAKVSVHPTPTLPRYTLQVA